MKYKDEIIILIEYFKNIPHSVYTEYSTFDFNMYDDSWLMFYESGGGKNWEEKNGKKIIELEFNFCVPKVWKVWIDSQYILISKVQEGVMLLQKPLMLPFYYDEKEKCNNPFIVGEEVLDIYWCEECEKHFNKDGCPEHGKKIE